MTDDLRYSTEDLQNLLTNSLEIDISLEKGPLTNFTRRFTIWRRGAAPSKVVNMAPKIVQLPDNSVLHYVTNFLNPDHNATVNPDLTVPFIEHEVWKKFFSAYYDIPSPKDPLFPVTDTKVFQTGRARSELMKFYTTHHQLRRIVSDESAGRLRNALVIYDYGILQRTKIPGQMMQYRLTELILRTMLRHILSYPYRKNHFIYIPLSDRFYSKSLFLQTYRRITSGSIKVKDDPSYDFLIHFFGFIYGMERPFDNVVLSPNDQRAIKSGTLTLPDQPSTSIFNRIPDDQLELINIVLEHKGEMAVYNLKQLKSFGESKTFYQILYRHVMRLKSASLSPAELNEIENDLDDTLETHESEHSDHSEAPEETSHPLVGSDNIPKKSLKAEMQLIEDEIPVVDDSDVDDDPVDTDTAPVEKEIEEDKRLDSILNKHADQITKEFTEEDSSFPEIQAETDIADYISSMSRPEQKRAIKLLGKLDQIKIRGLSLRDHIETSPKAISRRSVVPKGTTLIDADTQSSTIFDYDRQYLDNNFSADIGKTLTSFMRQGFFVSSVEEKREVTRIDDSTVYRVKFVSISDGKQHNVSFTLPNISREGIFKDNGNEYRLIKQKTAVPIAKVSPWRVGLFSSYNKSTVERTKTRNSFGQYILKIIDELVRDGLIKPIYGHLTIDHTPMPLEYSFIAERYTQLKVKGYTFIFDYPNRFNGLDEKTIDLLKSKEPEHGIYCGRAPAGHFLFYSSRNHILALNSLGEDTGKYTTFLGFLKELFPDRVTSNVPYEYTLVTIISQSYPLIFLLGLMHGLLPTLKHIKAKFRFVPKGKGLKLGPTETRIRFKDGSLVYDRYPLLPSFIISGLSWCMPQDYNISDFESEDVYFDILLRKGISTNQIKGIRAFFELFIDPITKSLLQDMGEPTNVTDLLIRATEMLTTQSHYPASSERHYRFRSFERFPSILYNELARAIATYSTDRTRGKTLNVNPKAVYQRIYSDPAKTIVDTINPIHEIKDVTKGSYAGIGGRTSRSFVVNDRTFSPDSVGVISESTPDSGKVGMIFSTVMDPNIIDLYGRTIPHEVGQEVNSAAKLMSVVGNLLPGLAQDDKC